jgi:hypothetical protein
VAFVVNGLRESPPLPTVIEPPRRPFCALNSNARPAARLFARMHGSWLEGVPPAPERQP